MAAPKQNAKKERLTRPLGRTKARNTPRAKSATAFANEGHDLQFTDEHHHILRLLARDGGCYTGTPLDVACPPPPEIVEGLFIGSRLYEAPVRRIDRDDVTCNYWPHLVDLIWAVAASRRLSKDCDEDSKRHAKEWSIIAVRSQEICLRPLITRDDLLSISQAAEEYLGEVAHRMRGLPQEVVFREPPWDPTPLVLALRTSMTTIDPTAPVPEPPPIPTPVNDALRQFAAIANWCRTPPHLGDPPPPPDQEASPPTRSELIKRRNERIVEISRAQQPSQRGAAKLLTICIADPLIQELLSRLGVHGDKYGRLTKDTVRNAVSPPEKRGKRCGKRAV